jgi:NAD(P)-dependent dehydrogenase (short-subunit alcohol dehydrogenase family)
VPEVAIADLSSQAEVRRLAAELLDRYERIDVLVNNAGAVFRTRRLTVDGIEETWALNHLAPFLLTNLLLDRLKRHPPARIITTASDAHQRAHIPFDDLAAGELSKGKAFGRYGETKLANILFTAELARRLEGSGVTANCYHPGLVATGFGRNNGRLINLAMSAIKPFARTPEKGAETLVWLADSPDVSGENGGYFVDKRRTLPSAEAQDMEVARRLWDLSRRQTSDPRAEAATA